MKQYSKKNIRVAIRGFVLSLFILSVLGACGDDKGEVKIPEENPFRFNTSTATITAQVVNGKKYSSEITTVKATARIIPATMSGMATLKAAPEVEIVASTNWSEGNLTLTLPTTINTEKLARFVSDDFWGVWSHYAITHLSSGGEDDVPKAFVISEVAAYNASGNKVYNLILFNPETLEANTPVFLYLNKEVIVYEKNGEALGKQMIKFNKGWNALAIDLGFKMGNSSFKPMFEYAQYIDDRSWLAFESILAEYGIHY